MLEAKILAVADTAEAMVSHRPYRPACGVAAAVAELLDNVGVLYDALVVEAVMQLDLGALADGQEVNADQLELWLGAE